MPADEPGNQLFETVGGTEFFASIPTGPGVYFLLGLDEELLYVGRAKNLRTRLRSYTRVGPREVRLGDLVSRTRRIRWEESPTEADAIARETQLLRGLRPPFNVTHAALSKHLAIALSGSGDRLRIRLASSAGASPEEMYAYPFEAVTADAHKALVRMLFRASDRRAPAAIGRGAGTEILIAADLGRALRSFLAGTSPRLLSLLEERISEGAAFDPILARAASRDLDCLRLFYRRGPKVVRALRARQGGKGGPTTPEELTRLIHADMQTQVGASVLVDRASVEGRIETLHRAGLGLRVIAARLNRQGVPRLRGGGPWQAVDVAEVVGQHVAAATREARLLATFHDDARNGLDGQVTRRGEC